MKIAPPNPFSARIVPPIERMAHDVAPEVCGQDHTIDVDLVRPPGHGDGVLIAGGSKHAGWTLYILNGELFYETSLVPWVERIAAPGKLRDGKLQIRYQQTMTQRPFDGAGALFVNGEKLADHIFDRCLLSTSYDGVSVGADLGNQVSLAYSGPTPFQGTIERVQIRIDARPSTLLETARFMRELTWRQ